MDVNGETAMAQVVRHKSRVGSGQASEQVCNDTRIGRTSKQDELYDGVVDQSVNMGFSGEAIRVCRSGERSQEQTISMIP
jgi:hypothetical protein